MHSAISPAQQFISSNMSYLEPNLELNNHQVMFTTASPQLSDLVDNDVQSLPGLMSPNSSTKDDDDDDMDYEAFASLKQLRVAGTLSQASCPMVMDNAFSLSALQQLQPPLQYSTYAVMPTTESMSSGLQLQQYPQAINLLPLQHTPLASLGSYNFGAPVLESCAAPALNYYFDSLGQQQQQPERSMLENVSVFDQSVLMVNTCSSDSLPQSMSPSASTLVQSPTISWASISRETSPACTPAPSVSRRPIFRPAKRRSSTYSRSGAKASRTTKSAGETELEGCSDSHCHGDASSSKRKRRVRQVKPKVKPTTFECEAPGCGKIFSRAYNLTSHMKTHSSERPFQCGSCSLAFARRHDRERHVRLHTGEKPYTCNSCGCGFMRNDALHRHQRICGQSPAAWMAMLQQQRPKEEDVEQNIFSSSD